MRARLFLGGRASSGCRPCNFIRQRRILIRIPGLSSRRSRARCASSSALLSLCSSQLFVQVNEISSVAGLPDVPRRSRSIPRFVRCGFFCGDSPSRISGIVSAIHGLAVSLLYLDRSRLFATPMSSVRAHLQSASGHLPYGPLRQSNSKLAFFRFPIIAGKLLPDVCWQN